MTDDEKTPFHKEGHEGENADWGQQSLPEKEELLEKNNEFNEVSSGRSDTQLEKDDVSESLEESFGELPEKAGGKLAKLKWVIVGIGIFVVALGISFYLAGLYVRKREATMPRQKTKRIAINPVKKHKKKMILTQYDLAPFLLRLKNTTGGEDHFLSVRLYIEFLGKELPKEIRTKKELLRTLIYKQLMKYFKDGKDSPEIENEFEKEVVPSLNTFFGKGGVYNVGFKEFVLR